MTSRATGLSAAVRFAAAIAPWAAVAVVAVAGGPWWSQQRMAAKLLAVAALTVWSLALTRRASSQITDSRDVSAAIASIAGWPMVVVGVNGLVLGLTPFGVALSALLAVVGLSFVLASRTGSRRVRERLAATAVGLAFGAVLAEGTVRVAGLGANLHEVDDAASVREFHHITPPGSAFVNQPKTLDEFGPALIETNSWGMRGPEPPPAPIDLLLIGDSFIEARQLAFEDTLAARLPAEFRTRNRDVGVASQGMRGWSPLLEWNWYLKTGRRLKPRHVLLFFFWNDLWPEGDEALTFRALLGPDGRPLGFDVPVEPAWVWYRHSRAVRLLEEGVRRYSFRALRASLVAMPRGRLTDEEALAAARQLGGQPALSEDDLRRLLSEPVDALGEPLGSFAKSEFWPGLRPRDQWTASQRLAARITAGRLAAFAQDIAADGGRLVVVYVPNAFQISERECRVARPLLRLPERGVLPAASGIQEWLREAAAAAGVELLDPSDRMRKHHSDSLEAPPLYLRADCHWSARGHQFMAEYLADWYLHASQPARLP